MMDEVLDMTGPRAVQIRLGDHAESPFRGEDPVQPRAAVFFDGRNIGRATARVFGTPAQTHFHPGLLAKRLCQRMGWSLGATHFYIGVPPQGRVIGGETAQDWAQRSERWTRAGVTVCTRPLTGANRERGIDLRMGFDLVRVFETTPVEIVVIASGDQDFQEAVAELRDRAKDLARPLTVATAFPASTQLGGRGVDTADLHLPLTSLDFTAARDLCDHGPRSFRPLTETDQSARPAPVNLPPLGMSLLRP